MQPAHVEKRGVLKIVIISIKFTNLTRQETYSLIRLVNGSSSPGWMVGIILLDMSLEKKDTC